LTICLSPLSEFLAERAVVHADRILAVRRAQAQRNLLTLSAWARSNPDLVSFAEPVGGVTAFPAFPGIDDTEDLCRELGRDHDVLLVPGGGFGHPGRVRLGFGGAEDAFATGLHRLRGVLAQRAEVRETSAVWRRPLSPQQALPARGSRTR
jgi:aspartate/methionine/tyrosine aminotransferase